MKILQLFVIGSRVQTRIQNWDRKPIHGVLFCSDPVRSHAYFPEWKPSFKKIREVLVYERKHHHKENGIALNERPYCQRKLQLKLPSQNEEKRGFTLQREWEQ